MKLIDNWKESWRFWSMRLAALGTAIATVLVASPEAAYTTWSVLPQEVKEMLPPEWTPLIGIGIFACSMVARVIKQQKLARGNA